ncbi:MAG: S4 domain-containing protein [Oceanococcaceae bacterium]
MTRRAQRDAAAAPPAVDGAFPSVRLDKWLWAARFYKMRSAASDAIHKGQVSVNDQRPKPSRNVRIGDELTIEKAGQTWTIRVEKLSDKRGAASVAAALYSESAESVARRAEQAAQNRAEWLSRPQPPGHKPEKHERARLRKLLQKL